MKFYQIKPSGLLLIILIMVGINMISFRILFSQQCKSFYLEDDCRKYHKKNFHLLRISRSTVFEIGTTSQFAVTFMGGQDYIITCCTEKKYYPLHLEVVSQDHKTVLYDNMHDEYLNSVGFTIDHTQNVIIRITMLAEGLKPKDFEENRACVGVSFQFQKTPKIGF